MTFIDEPLAVYRGRYEPDRYHFRAITDPHLLATPFVSPQLPPFAPGETVWIKERRMPDYAPRRAQLPRRKQPRLFPDVPVADYPS